MRRRIADADIVLVDDAAPALQHWLSDHRVKAVLVRPDRYALGGARDQADLQILLAAVAKARPDCSVLTPATLSAQTEY